MPPAPRTVAAFDFDKTLSRRDNFVPFLRAVAGNRVLAVALGSVTPLLATRRRDRAKERIVEGCLGGRPLAQLTASATTFSAEVLAHELRADVRARLEWHRAQGHAVVLVSASLDVYLAEIGKALDATAVLATRLAVGPDGCCTGGLEGANVRGPEKVRRLDAWLADAYGEAPVELWAYGDSRGDRELLARADHPVRVGRHPLEKL